MREIFTRRASLGAGQNLICSATRIANTARPVADPKENVLMGKIMSLCKRRGFICPSSGIYGGINGFWDYGSSH